MGDASRDARNSPIHFRPPVEQVCRAVVDITDPEKVFIVELDDAAVTSAARLGIGIGDALNGLHASDDLNPDGLTRFQRLLLGEIDGYRTNAVYFALDGRPAMFHVTVRESVGADPTRRYLTAEWVDADVSLTFDVDADEEIIDLAELITTGSLAEAPVGVALIDAREFRYVTLNHAFAHVLGYPRHELVGASCEVGFRPDDSVDDRATAAVGILRGDLDSLTTSIEVPGEPSITRLMTMSAVGARTPSARYLVVYVNDMPTPTPGIAQPLAPPMLTSPIAGDTTAYSYALVDELWRLQFLLPTASEWGLEEDKIMGFSIVPGIHPSDLPALFDAGDRVRSGQAARVVVRVHYRAAVGRYGYFPADCELSRTETLPAGWLALTYRNAAPDAATAVQDRLTALVAATRYEDPPAAPTSARTASAVAQVAAQFHLSDREAEIVRLLVDGYRVTTMTRTLHLSAGTIRNYLSGVFHKVGVRSQAGLIELVRGMADPA